MHLFLKLFILVKHSHLRLHVQQQVYAIQLLLPAASGDEVEHLYMQYVAVCAVLSS